MADIARMDYRIKLSFIGEKRGLIIEYRLNFKPKIWKGLIKDTIFGYFRETDMLFGHLQLDSKE